ncbi:carbohydate-binding domain-containing protein [Catenovulum sp. SM1970]|uniref:family 20 glycosylhydrolase n=1 Tax=Marinifaba aquimaris TaxID=2741323 RepID=UPI001572C968|nr:family 20 glycosylhydrolase [Marinifaba aquimaris]NTS78520.1 carbohydate-binding domain-containing protein [Marinifaba aquimaris]
MKKTLISLALSCSLMGCNVANESSVQSQSQLTINQVQLDQLAETLVVNYTVLSNQNGNCKPAGSQASKADEACYLVRVELTSQQDISANDWAIYFSQVDPLKMPANDELKVEHVNGDLHTVSPGINYQGLKAGKTTAIEFVVRNYHITEAEYMPNFYIAAKGLKAKTIQSTIALADDETGLELLPFAGELNNYAKTFGRGSEDKTARATSGHLFDKYQSLTLDESVLTTGLIPQPSYIKVNSADSLDISQGLNFVAKGINLKHIEAAQQRLASIGIKQNQQGINVELSPIRDKRKRNKGSYQLFIEADKIRILAADNEGAANAVNSIAGLIQVGKASLPLVTILDEPRYEFRGIHIDVSRNFHSKQFILDLMDQMAAYKLNKLHLHLGDDEGWRLEIKDLPELTDIGSKRCHDLTEQTCLIPQLGSGPDGNTHLDGYYSIEDYKEILTAANARHIQVIPSFDMPGHSRAVIKAMEARYNKFIAQGNEEEAKRYLLTDFDDKTEYESIQFYNDNTINVCMDSAYAFLDKVMDEMKAVHLAANQPLTVYHIGADETAGAWKESPVCKALMAEQGIEKAEQLGSYFIERVSQLLAEKDIQVAGWSDGMGHTRSEKMPQSVQSNSWGVLPWEGHVGAHKQANLGWDLVLSTPDTLYFDFPYEADPKEAGYSWASRHVSTYKVFQFMPDNLPIHAEMWVGPDGKPFEINDTVQKDKEGNITHRPLAKDKRFIGIQGQLWSETIRSDESAEYQIFPRFLAMAERAWYKADWEVPYNYQGAIYNRESGVFNSELQQKQQQDWNRFANVLSQKELAKLEIADIFYRVPTVGAKIHDGKLHANIALPGLAIEYRINEQAWQTYTQPVAIADKAIVEVRANSQSNGRKGRTIVVEN